MKEKFNQFKNWLIHKLGGYNAYEVQNYASLMYWHSQYECTKAQIEFMQTLNGMNADDWCKEVYDAISQHNEDLKNNLFVENNTEVKEEVD